MSVSPAFAHMRLRRREASFDSDATGDRSRRRRNRGKPEQHQLTVQKEIAASPARLERAARQLGMQPMQAAQIDPLKQQAGPRELKVPAQTRLAAGTPPKQKIQQPRGK